MNALHRVGSMSVAALLLSACGGTNQNTPVIPQPNGASSHHHPQKSSSGCFSIQDSTGGTYTAAKLGGGNPVDVEYSATPCQIGIYINGANGPNTLDSAKVNGPFAIGIYFDNAGSNAREDHTQICVNGSNGTGGCLSGTATSPGTGLDIRNTANFSADHTSIDSYTAGFATSPCPNNANHMTVDHTVITNTTYPWSYEGGNNNFNFQPGHDSPPFQGNSCAGSGVGNGPPFLLYVTNANNSTVTVYDENGNEQTLSGSFPGTGFPVGIAYDPSNHFIYVGNSRNNVSYMTVYDTGGNPQTVSGGFAGLGDPYGIAYYPSNQFLYVANYQNGDGSYAGVTVYDQNGNKQTLSGTFPGALQAMDVAYDPNNGYLYVVNNSTSFGQQALINAYDQNGNLQTLSGAFPGLLAGTAGILFNPSNGLLYISETNNSKILAFDQNGNPQTLSGSWAGLDGPKGMAYDPHNGSIYVANNGCCVSGGPGQSITVYDNNGNPRTLSGSFPGLDYPGGIVAVPESAGPLARKHHQRLTRGGISQPVVIR